MKTFFEEIKKQSLLTREIMFGLCVVITVSAVGMLWFRSAEEKIFITLNSNPERQEQFYAQRNENEETIFANLGTIFGGFQTGLASMLSIFGSSDTEIMVDDGETGTPRLLPLSKDR